MTVRALEVWWDGRVVGQLTQNQHGELGFAYSPGWLQNNDASPLSASLPKRVEPFSRRECRPFFGGLLPEESQRERIREGLEILRGKGLHPKVFVAPRHGFDRTTLHALRKEGIRVISDGFARIPFTRSRITRCV